MEQLKGAIEQLKNEYNGVRFEMQRCNQLLGMFDAHVTLILSYYNIFVCFRSQKEKSE